MVVSHKILILTLESPDPDTFKAGLFLNTIRQHVNLGLEVHVASLNPMSEKGMAALCEMGAIPLSAESIPGFTKIVPRGLGRLLRWNSNPQDWLLQPAARSHLAATIKPHAILGLQSYQTGIAAARIANSLNVPYTSWEHLSGYRLGASFRYAPSKMKAFLENAHTIAGVSESVLEAIRLRYQIDLPHGIVLPNPIPVGFENPPTKPAPYWLKNMDGRILLGAWTSWRNGNKRLDVLLDAFSRLHRMKPETILLLAGPVADATMAQRARTQAGVRHLDTISREEIHHLAHAVECCCISSDYETFGLPMIEALAAGKFVISTRCGGPEDVLDDPTLGSLCPAGDAQAMAEAMLDFCTRRRQIDQIRIARITQERFGEAAQAARWQKLHEDMLDKKNARL